jgi:Xaa-Pro dipeptidase
MIGLMSVTASSERLARLSSVIAADGLDGYLATGDESIAYLSGFRPLQMERFFAVLVTADRAAVIVPRLDLGQLTDAPPALERVPYDAGSDGLRELRGALGGVRSLGVEEDHLTLGRAIALQRLGITLVPAAGTMHQLRWRKDEDEIARVRAACELVETAIPRVFSTLAVGTVEREANARIESWLRENGAAAAHALVLFGENAANPHSEPGGRELRRGDIVCADVSACLDGYWGDLTRCATVGAPSDWAQQAWALTREAQARAIAACRPGTPARDVDAAQGTVIGSRPDLGGALHGAGHAIGLALHEPPFLVPHTETPLEAGMIFTIEPGIYQAGLGGLRLEDDVVVRAEGPEILSSLALDLRELPD